MFFQRSFRNKKEHRSQIWQNFQIITFSAVFLGLSHRSGHRVKSSEVTNKKLCHNYSLKRVFLNVLCYLVLNLLSALYLWAKVRSMSWPPHLTLSQWKYFCFEIFYFHSKCIKCIIRRFIDRVRLCGHINPRRAGAPSVTQRAGGGGGGRFYAPPSNSTPERRRDKRQAAFERAVKISKKLLRSFFRSGQKLGHQRSPKKKCSFSFRIVFR